MKLQPTAAYATLFDDKFREPVTGDKVAYIIQCCDSVIAVLSDEQLAEWLGQAAEYVEYPEARDYTDGFATLVFDVEGEQLVAVVDTGGEYLSGAFYEFCEGEGVKFQSIVDSLDVTDVPVRDIYTGAEKDNRKLLKLLHKIFN